MSSTTLFGSVPYLPSPWLAAALPPSALPRERVQLGRFPTPIHRLDVLEPDLGIDLFVKRDDLSSFDLSGNKVRKLEFLLAEAMHSGCDSVLTIGGVQSNHARSTAVAARQLGMEPHLILRTREPSEDPGLAGNLLLDRMVGARIQQVLHSLPSIYAAHMR